MRLNEIKLNLLRITLSTVIVEGSIAKKKWMNKLNSDTYYLVYWWYPYVKRLEFEVEHG